MNCRSQHTFLWVILLFCAACLGPQKHLYPPPADAPKKNIYVVNQGWHTGIVVFRSDVDTTVWPAIRDFPDAVFVEVGWGDADFYQAEENTLWMGFKALFLPTSTVLHVAGFSIPVETYFRGYQIINIQVSDSGFQRLCAYIQRSYATDKEGNVIPLGEGLYGANSYFYKARGKYFFTNTCNNWIARAIREAGCPITPLYACTATNAFYQLRKFGREIPDEEQ